MRRPAPLAAGALLLLALGAAGCKPSSLTPFGIGTKGPESLSSNINGTWSGETAGGGDVRFVVGNDEVTALLLIHKTATCTQRFEVIGTPLPVSDGEFSFEMALSPQGRFVVSGAFNTATACSGSYFFEALAAASGCPTTATGRFTATKQP